MVVSGHGVVRALAPFLQELFWFFPTVGKLCPQVVVSIKSLLFLQPQLKYLILCGGLLTQQS